MSILDKFKSKKEEKAPEKEKAKVVQAEKLRRSPMVKSESRPRSASGKTLKKEGKAKKSVQKEENFAWQHLVSTLVTEKSTLLVQDNKYMFKVRPEANKYQIKDAVENYYGVGVTKLNIIKIHPKKRIQGRTVGIKKGYKKAIVTLRAGDAITSAEGV